MKIKKMTNFTIKLVVKMLLLMICSIIGVGFVSGAEIFEFYVKFDVFFVVGIFVFGILIFVLSKKILSENLCNKNIVKLQKNDSFNLKNTNLKKYQLKKIFMFFNLLMVSSAMISGLKVLLEKLFFNNYLFLLLIGLVIVFLIVWSGINGLAKLDVVVFVFVMFLFGYFCFDLGHYDVSFCFGSNGFFVGLKNLFGSVVFAGLYVFMNIMQIQPIVSEMKLKLSKRKINVLAGIFACVMMMLLFVFCLFLNNNIGLSKFEMPFLEHFVNENSIIKICFVTGLIFALLSSLIGSLIGVKRGLLKHFNSKFGATFCAVIVAFLLSFFGFEFYVSIVYPIVGLLNFIIFVFL